MAGQPERFTAQEVADAVRDAHGLMTLAAKRLGCQPKTVGNYVKRYALVKEARDDAREGLKDFAESQLVKQMQDGNIAGIIFFLKTQAKERGYVERSEVTGADAGPVQTRIVIEYADSDK